jgi:hypothetical protein
MEDNMNRRRWFGLAATFVVMVMTAGVPAVGFAADISSTFSGHHVNAGTVRHDVTAGKHVLTLSHDFPVPEAPDPHWRLVDSKGNVFLLDRVKIKDDKLNRSITVPSYVSDIAKVEIWCAFVEVVLGEASFGKPIVLRTVKRAAK